jgi:signal recognition particle GTPase
LNKVCHLTQLTYLDKVLLQERQKNVELERKVAQHAITNTVKPETFSDQSEIEKLEQKLDVTSDRLLLAQDEIFTLKETLQHTSKSKEQELTLYEQMLESQKKAFQQQISTLKEQLSRSESRSDFNPTLPSSLLVEPQTVQSTPQTYYSLSASNNHDEDDEDDFEKEMERKLVASITENDNKSRSSSTQSVNRKTSAGKSRSNTSSALK